MNTKEYMNREKFRKERITCARRLVSLMIQGRNLIWIDESSHQMEWGAQHSRTWAPRRERIPFPTFSTDRGQISVNLYAAIGPSLKNNCLFWIADGCNTDNFVTFLKKIDEARRDSNEECTAALDNYGSHHSISTLAIVTKMNKFKLEWLSSNSSDLNCIERVFGILKRRVSKKMAFVDPAQMGHSSNYELFTQLVAETLHEFKPDEALNVCRSNLGHLKQLIDCGIAEDVRAMNYDNVAEFNFDRNNDRRFSYQ